MKIDRTSKYFIISLHALGVIVLSILFLMALLNFSVVEEYLNKMISLLMPFICAFVFAYLLNPFMCWLERSPLRCLDDKFGAKSKRIKRALSILIAYIFAGILITVFFAIVVPQVVNSIYGLISSVPFYLEELSLWVNDFLARYFSNMPFDQTQIDMILSYTEKTFNTFMEKALNLLPQLYEFTLAFTNSIKNILLGIIISIYMLASKEKFIAEAKKIVYAFLSKERSDKFLVLCRYIDSTFGGFIYAKVVDSFIIGLICFAGMSILKLPYAMLISIIVGVTNVIPYFGPFIGAIPSIIIILFVDWVQALIFAVFVLILQQFDGNILGPKLLGDSTGLTAFWVIFAVLVMGGCFGVLGMFIGVPTFAVIYTLSKGFIESKLKKRDMPVETAYYWPNPRR